MDWRAHAVIGAVAAVALLYLLGTHDFVSLVFIAAFGALSALVPDLDLEYSKGRKLLDMALIPFALLVAYFSACGSSLCIPDVSAAVIFFAIVGFYFVFFLLLKPRHRGIMHTLLAAAVFGVILYVLVGLHFTLAGLAGYVSHLLADRQIKLW